MISSDQDARRNTTGAVATPPVLMVRRGVAFLALGILLGMPASVAFADDLKTVKKELAQHGIRVSGSTLVLSEESALRKGLSKSRKLKKTLAGTATRAAKITKESDAMKSRIRALTKQNIQLNAQLARINPNNVGPYNKVVGALNATSGQIKLLNDQLERMAGGMRKSQLALSAARASYVGHVIQLRELADAIQASYAGKTSDQEIQAVIKKLNQTAGKQFELQTSRTFKSSLRRLKSLEDAILTESIPLRIQGNSLFVSVVINDKSPETMVVDSGASIVSLPLRMAQRVGIRPKDSDPTITLTLADGSQIPAKLTTIPTMRVGKFSASNVRCAVLGPEAPAAEPLLGMSFLGNFQFEINAQAGKMTMVSVGTSKERSSRGRRGNIKRKSK